MEIKPNAVVIGAGINELVAAHYLARTGRRVTVLEEHIARDDTDTGWVPPRIVCDLGLDQHALRIHFPDPWIVAPLPAGGRLELWRDMARSVAAIRRVNPRDAEKWPAFCERMRRLARLLETIYTVPPPDPVGRGIGELARFAGLGLRVRGLGRPGIEDLFRVLPMPVADLLDDWFECDALKAVLGAAGVMHLQQGPRSGGTAFRLLHAHVGCPAGVFRPPRSNIRQALAGRRGVEMRQTGATAIVVREGRVTSVVLGGGEEIPATLVVSGAEPKRTLLKLVDPAWLDPEFARAVRNIRSRGVVARVALTLDREPGFSTLVVAPSLDHLERAYDDAKYGRISRAPWLEACSEELTGAGIHRVNVHLQYAPYALVDGRWDEGRRAALAETAVEALSQHAPGLDDAVTERSVLSPRDLEEHCGFPEGQAHHAELTLDQALWMRPVPGWAQYRTPIGGLYLCGEATHPGAGVAGASGANAARVIVRDLTRQRGA